MNATIFFDMDGTIADLYSVQNWLPLLESHDETPYKDAVPLLRMASLARILNRLQREGYHIAIISWLSKASNADYDKRVTAAKENWLRTHLASVQFDEMHIVPYGTPKANFARTPQDILFDDEERNRDAWTGRAYDVDNILEILKNL